MIAKYLGIGAGIIIVGLLLWNAQLRLDLANCRAEKLIDDLAAHEAVNKELKEGRDAANKDGERLRQEQADRDKKLDAGLKELSRITVRLNAPRPPVTVMVESEPPVVITPPAGPSCALDRMALDDLRAFLNRGRAP